MIFSKRNKGSNNTTFNVLYYGKSYRDDFSSDEIYSFFPCKKADGKNGFDRYVLYNEKTQKGISYSIDGEYSDEQLFEVLNSRNIKIYDNMDVKSFWNR